MAVEEILRRSALRRLLEGLSARERRVIELRFGLADGQPRSLEEVGAQLGVTRERVRQIEAKTLAKLQVAAEAQPLADSLD